MERSFSSANVWILESDLEAIRSALLRSHMPEEQVTLFTGTNLRSDFEAWETFVHTDWSRWDFSEYDHDIGCRYWIQVAIENSCAETRRRLEAEIKPLDKLFFESMRLFGSAHVSREQLPLSEHPYFWETGTIHPEDDRM